jgi:hypothetical protein
MTRAEINRLSRQFRIQKQNKGEKRPGFVLANSVAEASDLFQRLTGSFWLQPLFEPALHDPIT